MYAPTPKRGSLSNSDTHVTCCHSRITISLFRNSVKVWETPESQERPVASSSATDKAFYPIFSSVQHIDPFFFNLLKQASQSHFQKLNPQWSHSEDTKFSLVSKLHARSHANERKIRAAEENFLWCSSLGWFASGPWEVEDNLWPCTSTKVFYLSISFKSTLQIVSFVHHCHGEVSTREVSIP